MKEFYTTNNKKVMVSDEDYDQVTQFNWYADRLGYIYRWTPQTMIRLHRDITKAAKGQIVDHADRNPLNNTQENLRITTTSNNRANSKKMLRNGFSLSRFKGVTRIKANRKKRWQAMICKNKKPTYLGTFSTELQAARAYDREALKLFGEYACTNKMLGLAA